MLTHTPDPVSVTVKVTATVASPKVVAIVVGVNENPAKCEIKVALTQRIRNLENNVDPQSQIGHLDDRVGYDPSEDELAEAVAILAECGAVRVVGC